MFAHHATIVKQLLSSAHLFSARFATLKLKNTSLMNYTVLKTVYAKTQVFLLL